jgi:transcriptional regulator GlxA family with amidase domain
MRELVALPPASPRRLAQLMRLLGGIAERERDCRELSRSAISEQPSALVQRQLAAAITHVGAHWREPLAQRHAARIAGMSPSGFAQVFRRWTGRTFTDYVGELRLAAVCRALTGSDRAIADIAFACGFGTLANFNRRFRRAFAMSPRDYRRAGRGAA